MPNRKRNEDARSTEEILREMNELSQSIDSSLAGLSGGAPERPDAPRRRGAMKSLLNFFVSVEPAEGESGDEAAAPAAPGDAAPAASQPPRPRVADLVAGEKPPTFELPDAEAGGDLGAKSLEEIYAEAGLGDT